MRRFLNTRVALDLQVNGVFLPGRYADYSVAGLTPETALQSARRWAELGALFLPTMITAPPEVYAESIPALLWAMDQEGGQGILGFAKEGPHLNPIAKGAHCPAYMTPGVNDQFDRLQELAQGRIILEHVAPEMPGGLDYIRHLVRRGVVVSIGHCDLNRETFMRAVDAGASLITHVCNGLPSTVDRAALKAFWRLLVSTDGGIAAFKDEGADSGLVCGFIDQTHAQWAVVDLIHAYLTTPGIVPMFIPDGVHVTADFVKVAAEVAGLDNLIITSDAAPICRAPLGIYHGIFGNTTVEVLQHPGKRPELSQLCGSLWTAADCVGCFSDSVPLSEDWAFTLCRDNPLAAINKALLRAGINPVARAKAVGDRLNWNAAAGKFEELM